MAPSHSLSLPPALPSALRSLVKQSVALLGQVIEAEMGRPGFERVESVRRRMRSLRREDVSELRKTRDELRDLSPEEQRDFARAYTLMLELMNACENAYRSFRLRESVQTPPTSVPDSIIYVLTAHPTEARSPANIAAFQKIQSILLEMLERERGVERANQRVILGEHDRAGLRHWLQVAWKTSIVRRKKPRVQDEADHIYSTLLREETLSTILDFARDVCPVYVRSWVGGDKDGHPGVDRTVFLDSLQISRKGVLVYVLAKLREVSGTLEMVNLSPLSKPLSKLLTRVVTSAKALSTVGTGDGRRVARFRSELRKLIEAYEKEVRILHPALSDLVILVRTFPALLVPLEFRESSDVLTEGGDGARAIRGMLRALRQVSQGGEPRWYCRGLIVSMAESMDHMRTAAKYVREAFGEFRLPVVPLFEQEAGLKNSLSIVKQLANEPAFRKARARHWDGNLEIMVGYSDSAKESGVLPSRRQIAETMAALDRLCQRENVRPIFFQGSGGSVDRGGGRIQDQTAWWPRGALKNYKVTIQGEMVERSLASPEITRGQLLRIASAAGRPQGKGPRLDPVLRGFADRIAELYRAEVNDTAFLRVVERATPYRYLDVLKMGSRPTKRTKELTVAGLRAIPWVLCWTQTRVLFPTWWGVGTAWKEASAADQKSLVRACTESPLFGTYVRSLGFTLAKVELPVFRIYLEASGLPEEDVDRIYSRFLTEYKAARVFVKQVTGDPKLLGWRPWLQESIDLRSPMIHPLNLLQLIALENEDFELLRLTVAGVASGMMTTG